MVEVFPQLLLVGPRVTHVLECASIWWISFVFKKFLRNKYFSPSARAHVHAYIIQNVVDIRVLDPGYKKSIPSTTGLVCKESFSITRLCVFARGHHTIQYNTIPSPVTIVSRHSNSAITHELHDNSSMINRVKLP